MSQNTRKQKTVSLFSLKNSSFRFKLERRKRSDLTMDATLGTENNPTVISGKTRSIVSRPFRSLFFFAAVRQVTASFAISLFLSLSLSLSRRCRFQLSCLLIKLYEQKTKNTVWQFEAKRCHKRMKRIPRPSLPLVRGLFFVRVDRLCIDRRKLERERERDSFVHMQFLFFFSFLLFTFFFGRTHRKEKARDIKEQTRRRRRRHNRERCDSIFFSARR